MGSSVPGGCQVQIGAHGENQEAIGIGSWQKAAPRTMTPIDHGTLSGRL